MNDNDNTDKSLAVLLARVDERTVAIQKSVESFGEELKAVNDAHLRRQRELEEKLSHKIDSLESKVENTYVKKEQFSPVQRAVYGTIALIVVTVLGAIISSVVKGG